MILYLIFGIALGLLTAVGVFLILKSRNAHNTDKFASDVQKKIDASFRDAIEKLATVSNQSLDGKKSEIMNDLSNKKDSIEKLILKMQQELKETNKKVEDSDKQTIGSFREVKAQLENNQKVTEQLSFTTEGLKNVLSNNQLRGQFGEQVAEDLLKMTGFVKGVDYKVNTASKGSAERPDFTILLPDGVKINVDSKFPYNNLQKSTETTDKAAKREHLKAFERDVKEKIKQLTNRNYINPADNTVDFVIMFIPNEMIFSYIYERLNSVWSEGMRQKVIFAGPFSFTAILRLIRQSYDNFKYQKNVRNIITYIQLFEEEFTKYNEEFEKIGDRIVSLTDQYNKVDSTRTKQLLKTVDKIRLEEPEHTPTPLLDVVSEKQN